MSESSTKMPAKEVFKTLLKMAHEAKEQVGEINGSLGERLRTQYDLHPDFTPFGWGLSKRIHYVFKTNELKARDMLRQARAALDFVELVMNEEGHGSDLADMALKAAQTKPVSSQPVDPASAEQQTQNNVVALQKGIKPLDDKASKEKKPKKDSVDAVREQLKADKKKSTGFVEEQREANAKGDQHIKDLANGEEPERAAVPDKRDYGSYRLNS